MSDSLAMVIRRLGWVWAVECSTYVWPPPVAWGGAAHSIGLISKREIHERNLAKSKHLKRGMSPMTLSDQAAASQIALVLHVCWLTNKFQDHLRFRRKGIQFPLLVRERYTCIIGKCLECRTEAVIFVRVVSCSTWGFF